MKGSYLDQYHLSEEGRAKLVEFDRSERRSFLIWSTICIVSAFTTVYFAFQQAANWLASL